MGEGDVRLIRAGWGQSAAARPRGSRTFSSAPDLPTRADDFINLLLGEGFQKNDRVILRLVSLTNGNTRASHLLQERITQFDDGTRMH